MIVQNLNGNPTIINGAFTNSSPIIVMAIGYKFSAANHAFAIFDTGDMTGTALYGYRFDTHTWSKEVGTSTPILYGSSMQYVDDATGLIVMAQRNTNPNYRPMFYNLKTKALGTMGAGNFASSTRFCGVMGGRYILMLSTQDPVLNIVDINTAQTIGIASGSWSIMPGPYSEFRPYRFWKGALNGSLYSVGFLVLMYNGNQAFMSFAFTTPPSNYGTITPTTNQTLGIIWGTVETANYLWIFCTNGIYRYNAMANSLTQVRTEIIGATGALYATATAYAAGASVLNWRTLAVGIMRVAVTSSNTKTWQQAVADGTIINMRKIDSAFLYVSDSEIYFLTSTFQFGRVSITGTIAPAYGFTPTNAKIIGIVDNKVWFAATDGTSTAVLYYDILGGVVNNIGAMAGIGIDALTTITSLYFINADSQTHIGVVNADMDELNDITLPPPNFAWDIVLHISTGGEDYFVFTKKGTTADNRVFVVSGSGSGSGISLLLEGQVISTINFG
jgi:hypothetical protein